MRRSHDHVLVVMFGPGGDWAERASRALGVTARQAQSIASGKGRMTRRHWARLAAIVGGKPHNLELELGVRKAALEREYGNHIKRVEAARGEIEKALGRPI